MEQSNPGGGIATAAARSPLERQHDVAELIPTRGDLPPQAHDQARVLIGGLLGISAAIGPAFLLIFGLFLKPMSADLGWSRAAIMAAFSIIIAGSIASTVVAGHVMDRIGLRATALFATISMPLLVCLLAASTLVSWPLYLGVAATLGMIAGFSSPIAYLGLVTRWFDARLGLAIAVVTCGLGLGQIANSFTATHAIEGFGWRTGMCVVAGWSGALGIAAWVLVPWRRTPKAVTVPVTRAGRRRLLGDPVFLMLTLAFMLVMLVTASVVTNIGAALSDRGMSPAVIATCVATMGAASLLARLLAGILLSWFSPRSIGGVVFVAQGVGCAILLAGASPLSAYLGAFLVSFALGVEGDLLPYVLRRRFGDHPFGKAYGYMFAGAQFGPVIGPPMIALAYDTSGTYEIAFAGLLICSLSAALLLVLALGRPVSRPESV